MVGRCAYCLDIIFRLFLLLFIRIDLSHFSGRSEWILGFLCMQLLIEFYFHSFETSQVFRSCAEEVNIVWI